MIIDSDEIEEALTTRVAIVGAGAVGITMAVALARRGVEVVLVESGGRSFEAASQALNDAASNGRPHTGISEGRARVLGGTTTLWGGQLIPFRQIDFAARPWLNLPAWPITRDLLMPYYEAVAEMLGLPLIEGGDDSVWQALGLARPALGEALEPVLTRWLKQPNLARMFDRELESLINLRVILHASAVDFGYDGDGRTITSVKLRSRRGRDVELTAAHVVISCGTIEASRLMLAAARDPVTPWSGNEWLGAAFQDHLDLRGGAVRQLDKRAFGAAFDNIYLRGFKYNPKITLTPAMQERHFITNVAGNFVFESSLSEHLGYLKIFLKALRSGAPPPNLRSFPGHFVAIARVFGPLVVRYLRDNRAFNPADIGTSLRLHCEQVPVKDSRIRLDPTRKDANGMPFVALDWRVDGREIEAMAVYCEELRDGLKRAGLAEIDIDPRIVARDPAILGDARDTNHQCGGLQMSSDPSGGVVDPDLRVHGTTNLYVAGAAVFPSSSFANPTFTAMALGLRLVDRLSGMR